VSRWQRWTKTLGVADLATKKPYALDDNVRIASVSKTFTAKAVLQLVDQKKLSLDDKVESFVPGIPNGDRITARELLDMSSEIYDFTSYEPFLDEFAADPMLAWTPADAVALMRKNPSQFEPGVKRSTATAITSCSA
jgi:D-alanyl-D-alanine carboxypeptidase